MHLTLQAGIRSIPDKKAAGLQTGLRFREARSSQQEPVYADFLRLPAARFLPLAD